MFVEIKTMKNIYFIIALLLPLSLFAQTEVNGSIVALEGSKGLELKKTNDTITVWFTPTESFWSVRIVNNIKQPVTIEWDKCSFAYNGASSKLIFDETVILNKDNPLPSETIPVASYISKNIMPVSNVSADFVNLTISKRFVKEKYEQTGKPESVKISLNILVNNKPKLFEYNFEISPKVKK